MNPLSLAAAAAESPAATALVFEGHAWSFSALQSLSARMATWLDERGVGQGDRVSVRASNRPEVVALLFALIELGATFVPIHPRLTASEAAALEADAAPALSFDDEGVTALSLEASRLPLATPPQHVSEALPLAMLFTSGTTGKPKAAILSRRAFLAAAAASEQNLGWREGDRWLLSMPVCHVGGLSILIRCLLARKTVALHAGFDAEAVLCEIVSGGVTMLSVVPTMLHRLLSADTLNVLAKLRVMLVGGAGCPQTLLDVCAARRVPALTTYGLTEACSQVTSQRPRDPALSEPGSGQVLEGSRVWITDDEGQVLPSGSIGRIVVDGPALMDGYWRQPPRRGPLETGDLGALDEQGRLFVHARRTDLIVTGGENVYPVEVEQALLSLPGVEQVVVFGVDDEEWGQRVAAAIVPSATIDEARLAEGIDTALAKHKRPRLICFTDALPTKGPGKIDRAGAARALRAKLRPLRR